MSAFVTTPGAGSFLGAKSLTPTRAAEPVVAIPGSEDRSYASSVSYAATAAAVSTLATIGASKDVASKKRTAFSCRRAFENELGVQAPAGFWDPVGFCKDGSEEDFRRRRATEIKHGRVSMIACIGYITPEFFKWPGYLSPNLGLKFADVPNGLAALSKAPAIGFGQMFLFAGTVETAFFIQEDGRDPGDFAQAGPLGVPNAGKPMEDAEGRKRKLSAEIANGRLAMMAIIGMFFQDGLTGSAWGSWANYVESPLR